MEINSKPDEIAVHGLYAYRAYAVPLQTGDWEGWYVIHTQDKIAILSGPKKIPWQFAVGEAAFAAAEKKARWEIDHVVGEFKQPDCGTNRLG